MDTKLKNSRKIRTILAIVAILIITLGNVCIFPVIGVNAEKEYKEIEQKAEISEGYINELVLGSYVLYDEMTDITQAYPEEVADVMLSWSENFEIYRNALDYCASMGENGSITNTTRDLEILLDIENAESDQIEDLQEEYLSYFVLVYNEKGELSVENIWDSYGREDELVKIILRCARQNDFQELLLSYREEAYAQEMDSAASEEWGAGQTEEQGGFPKNCRIVYAIPEGEAAAYGTWSNAYWGRLYTYSQNGASLLFIGSLAALVVIMFLLTSNKIWRKTIDFNRRGPWYLAEAAVIGAFGLMVAHDGFVETNSQYVSMFGFKNLFQLLQQGTIEQIMNAFEITVVIGLIYVGWYLCMLVLRPIFSLGPIAYVRQYSLIYLVCKKGIGWCKRCWDRTKEEIAHIDFSNKTIKTIRKIVILNFIILAVLSCFWFFGIFALIIYSIVLFLLIKKQYDKIEQDYQALRQATERIAQGDLEYQDEKDWGVFEPLKNELAKIRSGFSRAVAEEVKSQRMKAELITNVSHDLKTPLTAITTYVELLKDEEITAEQRRSYIEILEKKSLRLKVLVEDLFEVSKATSNTIKLDLMEVDVVNLLKQVSVEHESRFADMGLSVKWKLPEEKVMLMLDNQKTYRIFENLFVNIEKYAMPNSRVFIEVEGGEQVQIAIKNMSAQELMVTGEEITERFVRGDSSRTTEGSGLGLAIAKSFTEAQKGSFAVTVDGDLFKVTICW